VAAAVAVINQVEARKAILQAARAARSLLRREPAAARDREPEVEALAERTGIPWFALLAAADVLGCAAKTANGDCRAGAPRAVRRERR
jgi:hypothetical protein